jgi:hypothetical protein
MMMGSDFSKRKAFCFLPLSLLRGCEIVRAKKLAGHARALVVVIDESSMTSID